MVQIAGQIQRGLTTHGRQYGIHIFDRADFLNRPGGQGLEVNCIGHHGVGHDGGRIGVNEYHTVPFLFKRFASLSTRVIKLTGLTNNNRTGTDDEYGVNIVSAGHGIRFFGGLCRSVIQREPCNTCIGI